MVKRKAKWLGRGSAILGLLAALLVVFPPAFSFAGECLSQSGDDAYDPAGCAQAGAPAMAGSYSGDDAYDPAAGGLSATPSFSPRATLAVDSSHSGDDAYDPAAGGLSATPSFSPRPTSAADSSYSGDDAYDPAAGGLSADAASADCGLTAGEIARRIAARTPGGFSGDDRYDPAAGGIPELSVSASTGVAGQLAACTPAALDALVAGFGPAQLLRGL
jgi:hypothetical protein